MPSSISDLLNQIQTARYGEEVRSAIHDSIEECYENVELARTNAATATSAATSAAESATIAATSATNAAASATSAVQNVNTIIGDVSDYVSDGVTVSSAIAAAISVAESADSAITSATTAATNAASTANLAAGNATSAVANVNRILGDVSGYVSQNVTVASTIASAINATNNASTAADDASAAAISASTAATGATAVTALAQDIVNKWNGTGVYEQDGALKDDIEDTLDELQEAATLWTEGTIETDSLLTQITSAISSATAAANSVASAIAACEEQTDNAEQAATEAYDAKSEAAGAASSARSQAASAEQAASECAEMTQLAETAKNNANSAATAAVAAAARISALEVTSSQVEPNVPSSVTVTFLENAETQHYKLDFKISKGKTGDSMIVKGAAYVDETALKTGVSNPTEGDMYNVGVAPPYNIYRYTGEGTGLDAVWEDQGPIGFTIENLTNEDINNLWSNSYATGSVSKYLDDAGFQHLITNKIVAALNNKVNVDGNKGLSTNDFTSQDAEALRETIPGDIETLRTGKVSVQVGKQLSTEDYTTFEKNKLASLPHTQAGAVAIDTALSTSSTNLIRNNAVAAAVNTINNDLSALTSNTPFISDIASEFNEQTTYEVGSYCIYNRTLYKCITATSGAWREARWEAVSLASEIKSNKTSISNLQTSIGNVNTSIGTINTNIGTIQNDISDIEDLISDLEDVDNDLAINSAIEYNPSSTYSVGQYCVHDHKLYRCTTAIDSSHEFDVTEWDRTTVDAAIGLLRTRVDNAEAHLIAQLANEYDSTATYAVGDYCYYGNTYYCCKTAISEAEEWTAAHWDEATIMGMVNSKISGVTSTIEANGDITVNIASFNSLPLTKNVTGLTANHYVVYYNLGTPASQTANWSVQTSSGSFTISGTNAISSTGTTARFVFSKALRSLSV